MRETTIPDEDSNGLESGKKDSGHELRWSCTCAMKELYMCFEGFQFDMLGIYNLVLVVGGRSLRHLLAAE